MAIVGGGPAGLAATLVLGRMRRRVLLVDADDPAHAISERVHGCSPTTASRRGSSPASPAGPLPVRQRQQFEQAPVDDAPPTASGFSLTAGGVAYEAGVVVLATGLSCELPHGARPLGRVARFATSSRREPPVV